MMNYKSHIERSSLKRHSVDLVRINLLVNDLHFGISLNIRRLHNSELNALAT
jgi:hypothetical protein